jgi:hypothetical protein
MIVAAVRPPAIPRSFAAQKQTSMQEAGSPRARIEWVSSIYPEEQLLASIDRIHWMLEIAKGLR